MDTSLAAYDQAFALLGMACPCEAMGIVTDGLLRTPYDQQELADSWVRLGSCVNAILAAVTVH